MIFCRSPNNKSFLKTLLSLDNVFNAPIRTGLVQSEYQAFNNHSKMLDNVIEKLIIVFVVEQIHFLKNF